MAGKSSTLAREGHGTRSMGVIPFSTTLGRDARMNYSMDFEFEPTGLIISSQTTC